MTEFLGADTQGHEVVERIGFIDESRAYLLKINGYEVDFGTINEGISWNDAAFSSLRATYTDLDVAPEKLDTQ